MHLFFVLVLEDLVGLHRTITSSFFGVSGWGIDLDYCGVEWFALKMNWDLSVVFEIAPKYCISVASLVVQTIKNLPAVQKTQVQSQVGKIPGRKEWLPTAVFLPGEFHEQRSLVGYSPSHCKELDMNEWLTLTFTAFWTLLLTMRTSYFLLKCISQDWKQNKTKSPPLNNIGWSSNLQWAIAQTKYRDNCFQ